MKKSLKFHKRNRKIPVSNSLCLRPEACNLIKKKLWLSCFPVNFVRYLRTPFLQNASGRLLPNIVMQKLQIFHDFQHTFIHLQYSCSTFVRFFEEMSFLQETSSRLTNKINQLQNLVVVETLDLILTRLFQDSQTINHGQLILYDS